MREHAALRAALGCAGGVPSEWACYRFTRKLREYSGLLDACLDRVTDALHAEMPEMGQNVAIDGSDLPAYANGQRFISKNGPERERFSDPDATWGHRSAVSTRRGGGYYRYKLHAAVCTASGLPPSPGPSRRRARLRTTSLCPDRLGSRSRVRRADGNHG